MHIGVTFANAARPGDPAHPGHLHIHDDDIGVRPVGDVERLLGRRGFTDADNALGVIKNES
jgi:hypothetical protein